MGRVSRQIRPIIGESDFLQPEESAAGSHGQELRARRTCTTTTTSTSPTYDQSSRLATSERASTLQPEAWASRNAVSGSSATPPRPAQWNGQPRSCTYP